MGLSDRIQLGLRLVMRAFRSAVLNQPEADPVTQRRGTVRLEDGSVVKRTCSNNRARAGSQHTHDDL